MRTTYTAILLLFVLWTTGCTTAAAADSGAAFRSSVSVEAETLQPKALARQDIAEFETFINTQLEQFRIPGTAVVLVQGGEIVYAEGFGLRDLDSGELVTPETLMLLGSISKSMTTMMVATMVDEGLLEWDTPVQAVLPEFAVANPEASRQITMRDMFCACSGVARRDLEIHFHAKELTAESVIKSIESFPLVSGVGEEFHYSNQMVAVGGYAAAAAALHGYVTLAAVGDDYEALRDRYVDQMEQRVFAPTGMTSSTFSFEEALAGNFATPYVLNAGPHYVRLSPDLERNLIALAPAGGVWSNALDVGRYLITQLNAGVAADGTRVVSAENLAATWQPQIAVDADTRYGLAWVVDTYRGIPLIWHDGGSLGYETYMAFLPEAGLGIGIITNSGDPVANHLNKAIQMRLFELVYDQPPLAETYVEREITGVHQRLSAWASTLREIDPAEVEPILGRYSNEALGEVELRLEDGRLIMDTGDFTVGLRSSPPTGFKVKRFQVYAPIFLSLAVTATEMEDGEIELSLNEEGSIDVYHFTPVP